MEILRQNIVEFSRAKRPRLTLSILRLAHQTSLIEGARQIFHKKGIFFIALKSSLMEQSSSGNCFIKGDTNGAVAL